MSSWLKKSPDELHALRLSVYGWVEKAMAAVESFYDEAGERGIFWPDTGRFGTPAPAGPELKAHFTSTNRCYIGLLYADRCLTDKDLGKRPGWHDWFLKYLINNKDFIGKKQDLLVEPASDKFLSHFDIAHLSDTVLIYDYLKNFRGQSINSPFLMEENGYNSFKEILYTQLSKILENYENAELNFDGSSKKENRHYFVTLHVFRALAILGKERSKIKDLDKYVESTRQFCIEQCFFSQRAILHLIDPYRLVFATVIHVLYAPESDKDLSIAVLQALAEAQLPNGKWTNSHPITRKEGDELWYIASHEIALCLTWLYFQPGIPDIGREILLGMMENYFSNWVVRTYRSEVLVKGRSFKGWSDDHRLSHDALDGWASAIVCHFLANYHAVLDDHINRRVVENLGLEASSERYLIDGMSSKVNQHWQVPYRISNMACAEKTTVWPDFSPYAWCPRAKEAGAASTISEVISSEWTDPTYDESLSKRLAHSLILPVLNHRNGLPDKNACCGIFPGPPGTRKTSLVSTVAEVLDWPLISVPASVIFDHGFDFLEARATEVFRQLNYLSRCVIFFDEFEEFFRDRNPKQRVSTDSKNGSISGRPEKIQESSDREQEPLDQFRITDQNGDTNSYETPIRPIHDRTIAAFTTSAMLSRLQSLHDQACSIVILATNHLEVLDEAVIRPGRFDFLEWISNPTLARIEQHLSNTPEKSRKICGFPKGEEERWKRLANHLWTGIQSAEGHVCCPGVQANLFREENDAPAELLPGPEENPLKCRFPFRFLNPCISIATHLMENNTSDKKIVDAVENEVKKPLHFCSRY